jgi:hypothetical protein
MRYPLTFVIAALAAVACKSDSTGPGATSAISGVTPEAIFAPAVDTVMLGDTATITYYVIAQNGDTISGVPVSVAIDDSLIAFIAGDSTSGIDSVTGVAVGATTLAINALNAAGNIIPGVEADVEVLVVPQAIAALALSVTADTLAVGTTVTLKATALQPDDSTSSGHTITWFSENSLVATVNPRGIVTGVSPGIARIIALTDGGVSATATILVTPAAAASIKRGGRGGRVGGHGP